MIVILASLLASALYLSSPKRRQTPLPPSNFSFTDYRNRLNNFPINQTKNFAEHNPPNKLKVPHQVTTPLMGKVLEFKKPTKD